MFFRFSLRALAEAGRAPWFAFFNLRFVLATGARCGREMRNRTV